MLAVVVARVDVPVTVTSLAVRVLVELMFPAVKVVPVELVNTSFVMVALVAVRLVKKESTLFNRFEKKFVEVALVVVELVMIEFSKTVLVAFRFVMFPFVASTVPVAYIIVVVPSKPFAPAGPVAPAGPAGPAVPPELFVDAT